MASLRGHTLLRWSPPPPSSPAAPIAVARASDGRKACYCDYGLEQADVAPPGGDRRIDPPWAAGAATRSRSARSAARVRRAASRRR